MDVDKDCGNQEFQNVRFCITRKIEALHLENLASILDNDEKISIIFLLIDKRTDFYEITKNLEAGCYSKFLELHYKEEWKEKLIETLLIIKNIDVIRNVLDFDFNEIEKIKEYFVNHTNLNLIIKKLYLLCESLDRREVESLVCEVNARLGITENLNGNRRILEVHLLHWLQQKLISIDEECPDLTNLLESLEKINCSNVLHLFDDISQSLCIPWIGKYKRLCIIVNIVNFMDRRRSRSSSLKDGKKLQETFQNLNFDVEEPFLNLTEEEMHLLLDSLQEPQYSDYGCIFMFLMSHGCAGEVLFSDLKNLSVRTIEQKFCCENLKNVFKLLVLQSCQGNLEGMIEPSLVADSSDGPESDQTGNKNPIANPLPLLHFALFQATVDEFVAWRDPVEGSWFINDICKELQNLTEPTKISDWAVKVTDRVSNRRGRTIHKNKFYVQIPRYSSSTPVHYVLPRYGKNP